MFFVGPSLFPKKEISWTMHTQVSLPISTIEKAVDLLTQEKSLWKDRERKQAS